MWAFLYRKCPTSLADLLLSNLSSFSDIIPIVSMVRILLTLLFRSPLHDILHANGNLTSSHPLLFMLNTLWCCFRILKLFKNPIQFQTLLPISYLSTSFDRGIHTEMFLGPEDDKKEIGSSVWNSIGFLSSLRIPKQLQKVLLVFTESAFDSFILLQMRLSHPEFWVGQRDTVMYWVVTKLNFGKNISKVSSLPCTSPEFIRNGQKNSNNIEVTTLLEWRVNHQFVFILCISQIF